MGVFYAIAITFGIFIHLFYLFNFMYIGSAFGLGIISWQGLSKKNRYKARMLTQLLIGGYLFFGLGFGLIYVFQGYLEPENMQIEGFWFWLLAGYFAAGVMHYAIAKIFGPFIFNRGWCGWACWTAAILNYLPWKKSSGRIKKLGIVRYFHFIISTALIFILVFNFNYTLSSTQGIVDLTGSPSNNTYIFVYLYEIPEFLWFFVGNIFYYASGILLAYILKDNRAFCKYLCPITVFLKIGSKFSIMKVEGNQDECTSCKSCERACPMDIKISEYVKRGLRVSSSECIICINCVNNCPKGILKLTNKIDKPSGEFIRYRE